MSFYIEPDYSLTQDNINTVISTALSNPTNFLSNLTTALGSNANNFIITAIAVSSTIAAEPMPIFVSNTPTFTSDTQSISFVLTIVNTNGYIYVGLEKTLNSTTSRLLQGTTNSSSNASTNASTNTSSNSSSNTTSSNSSTNTSTYNLTMPSWTQLLAGNDVNNNVLFNYTVYYATSNNNLTINISNLTAGVTYNVYYGASNEIYPRLFTSLYGNYIATTTASNGGGQTTTYGENNRGILMGFLILMGIFVMII